MQNTVDYGKAFTFAQEDPDWIKKILIGGVLALIPVVGWLLLAGYGLEVTRRVIAGEAKLLPEWTDFGDLIKKGLFNWIVNLVYALPLIVVGVCIMGPVFGFAGAAGSDSESGGALAGVANVVGACFGCLAMIYALAMTVITPVFIGKLAATGEIGPALRVSEVIAIFRSNPGMFVIVALLAAIALSVLASLGSLLCGIGALFTVPFGTVAMAHLYGQAYRNATGGSASNIQTAM